MTFSFWKGDFDKEMQGNFTSADKGQIFHSFMFWNGTSAVSLKKEKLEEMRNSIETVYNAMKKSGVI